MYTKDSVDAVASCVGSIILIIIAVVLGLWINSAGDTKCRRLYGDEWRVSGWYTKYCTNNNGDIKGF